MKRCHFSKILPALTVLIALTVSQPAIGNETPIGEIDKVEGEVTVTRSDGRQITGSVGLSLYPGDQIATGEDAEVRFSLQEGGQFRLGEEAQMSVDELSGPEVEDDEPILRLVLGYLWSRLQKIKGQPGRLSLHTPTAVIGVRGTEFDTVVSLDATSVVAVDEGSVEVEAEDEKVTLNEGRMTEVEMDVKPAPPVRVIPKEKRDWQAWRKQRIKRLFKNLPRMAPKFRERFEAMVSRFTGFTDKIREASARLRKTMEKVRQAKKERNRKALGRSVRKLKMQVERFKKGAGRFRKSLNRVRVMGRISHRIEKFAAKNKARFSDQENATIESNLAAISEKRVQLRSTIRETISDIRKVFKELRELRREMRSMRK